MIITISGANFSASNIGTLSTWTVSKSIGAGAEHSIPSYVDKNSAFNYTITLKDGYTFGTYSVTMGGQTITPTVTETSMTINIASVTGAIRIEVKTINSSTGEEDQPITPDPEPDEPGTGGESGDNESYEEVQIELTLVDNSYISKETGEIVTGTTYKNWKTTEYISVNANENYRVIANTFTGTSSGVGASVYGYDSNKNPLVCILGEHDASSGAYFTIPENVKYIKLGTIVTKCELSLFKVPYLYPEITWIADQYVSKETTGTTPIAAGTIKTASGWSTTNYIDVSKYKKLSYTATIPTGGTSSVYCVYGYDSNKNPIRPILTPTSESNTFSNYLIEIVDSDIAYIVACGHSKTLAPSIAFTN